MGKHWSRDVMVVTASSTGCICLPVWLWNDELNPVRPWQWAHGRRCLRCSGLAGAGTHCWKGQVARPAWARIRLLGSCGVFPGVHVMIKWFGMQGNQSDGGEMHERDDTDHSYAALIIGMKTLEARWNGANQGFDKSWMCLEWISFQACHTKMCDVFSGLNSVAVSLDRQIIVLMM